MRNSVSIIALGLAFATWHIVKAEATNKQDIELETKYIVRTPLKDNNGYKETKIYPSGSIRIRSFLGNNTNSGTLFEDRRIHRDEVLAYYLEEAKIPQQRTTKIAEKKPQIKKVRFADDEQERNKVNNQSEKGKEKVSSGESYSKLSEIERKLQEIDIELRRIQELKGTDREFEEPEKELGQVKKEIGETHNKQKLHKWTSVPKVENVGRAMATRKRVIRLQVIELELTKLEEKKKSPKEQTLQQPDEDQPDNESALQKGLKKGVRELKIWGQKGLENYIKPNYIQPHSLRAWAKKAKPLQEARLWGHTSNIKAYLEFRNEQLQNKN